MIIKQSRESSSHWTFITALSIKKKKTDVVQHHLTQRQGDTKRTDEYTSCHEQDCEALSTRHDPQLQAKLRLMRAGDLFVSMASVFLFVLSLPIPMGARRLPF